MGFAADTAAILAGPLGVDAVHAPAAGDPVALRVLPRLGDADMTFGEARIVSDGAQFLVAVADAPAIASGDRLTVDGVAYTVRGAPRRSDRRLWWIVTASP